MPSSQSESLPLVAASGSHADDAFAPASGLRPLDVFLMLGLVALAAFLVLIMSGSMGILSRPLIGGSRTPAGLEGLPPIEPPRLPPPSRQSPDARDPDADPERWLASTSRPARDSRVVVRKPVRDAKPIDDAAVPPAIDPLAEMKRLLVEAQTDRRLLEAENRELRERIERLEKASSASSRDASDSAAH